MQLFREGTNGDTRVSEFNGTLPAHTCHTPLETRTARILKPVHSYKSHVKTRLFIHVSRDLFLSGVLSQSHSLLGHRPRDEYKVNDPPFKIRSFLASIGSGLHRDVEMTQTWILRMPYDSQYRQDIGGSTDEETDFRPEMGRKIFCSPLQPWSRVEGKYLVDFRGMPPDAGSIPRVVHLWENASALMLSPGRRAPPPHPPSLGG